MKGKPVGVFKISSAFPRVKHKVKTMMKPRMALRITAHVMALGRVSEASLISSAEGRNQHGTLYMLDRMTLTHVHAAIKAQH